MSSDRSWFFNDRALLAKKRQPASSPSRIFRNHVLWANDAFGMECKWCGKCDVDLVKSGEKWSCEDCLKTLMPMERPKGGRGWT